MRFNDRIPQCATVSPMLNIGMMLDHPTGSYYFGKYGQSILNGGIGDVNSITGIGHSFKSTLAAAIVLILCERYGCVDGIHYDTENAFRYDRINQLAIRLPRMSQIDFLNPLDSRRDKYTLTNAGLVLDGGKIQYGDRFHEQVTKFAKDKYQEKKPVLFTTPFMESGNPIKIKSPTAMLYDSFSMLKISNVIEGKVEEYKVGDSERNTVSLDEGRYKTQINNEMPGLSRLGELRFIMTAHTQKAVNMEGKFAVSKQNLAYGKRDYEIKGVGTSFMKINELILDIQNVTKLDASTAKTGVEFPLDDDDRNEHCKDLNLLTVVISRNKHGHTGTVIKLIVSQREGVLPHLSMYRTLREDKYGVTIAGHSNYLTLLPNLNLQRTTVRATINNNYNLRRALEITADMLQIKYLFCPEGKIHLCTPEELYNDLITMGYSWDTLLNTRGYWVFEEEDNDNLPFLSTMDLLRMRAGLYTPYWLKQDYIKTTSGYLREVLDKIPPDQIKG